MDGETTARFDDEMALSVSGLTRRFEEHLCVLVRQGQIRQSTMDFYVFQLRKLAKEHASHPARYFKPTQCRVPFTNHFVRSAKRCFAWASEEELVGKNHWKKVKAPPTGQRQRVLTDEEFARLVSVCNEGFARFLRVGRETAARPIELRELLWGSVNLDDRVLLLTNFKSRDSRRDGKKVRPILLTPLAVQLLTELREASPGAAHDSHVFADKDGYAWGPNALRCQMRRARKAAGLDTPGKERVVLYTMRHTRATDLTRKGVRDNTLAEILGHTNTQMTRRYQHLSSGDLINIIDQADGRLR